MQTIVIVTPQLQLLGQWDSRMHEDDAGCLRLRNETLDSLRNSDHASFHFV